MNTFKTFLQKGFLVLAVLLGTKANCNNITVTNTVLKDQVNASQYVRVNFDLQWENSWRNDIAGAGQAVPFNYDAAWVFVKYRECGGVWKHATLNVANTTHTISANATLTVGTTAGVGKGCFIYRTSNGNGTFSLNNVGLRWNYGADGLTNITNVEIRVFAIEMVYITQGTLNLPTDGGTGGWTAMWVTFNNTSLPSITSEAPLANGALRWNGAINGGYAGITGKSDALNANYPKGFAAYYCMKYAVSCKQYVDFLNTLTFPQQQTRICNGVPPSSPANTYVFNCDVISTGQYQHQNRIIVVKTPGVTSSVPAEFACNLNNNGAYNDATDGQDIPCSNVYNEDQIAYADWSALRPMSLLEYEKACRGASQPAVINEYAWGTPNLCTSTTYNLINAGAANESVINTCVSTTAGNALIATTNGPAFNNNIKRYVRAGAFATSSSNRLSSGATYYGVMQMSETFVIVVSVSEQGRTAGGPNLVQYPGNFSRNIHGDGNLNAIGDCDVPPFSMSLPGWPGTNGTGIGIKGGCFCSAINSNVAGRVSDLSDQALNYTRANYKWTYANIRCVRSEQ